MSTTFRSDLDPAREGQDTVRSRGKIGPRVWWWVGVLAIVGFVIGALVMVGWVVDETHFDRPSEDFDELETQLQNLRGVESVDKERWVEAPTFSNPTSWMSVTVDAAGLPELLRVACTTGYPDPVMWSIRVRTSRAALVSLNATPADPDADRGNPPCPDFGFDVVRLVDELDRIAPRLAIQPSIWESGRLAVVALEEEMPTGFSHLLPLVDHTADLLAAAGLDARDVVEINSTNLGVTLEPGESHEYLALLTKLSEDHAVSSFWADGGGTAVDGTERIQIVAPNEQHAAIEQIIRSSRLHVADLPVRFIEQ